VEGVAVTVEVDDCWALRVVELDVDGVTDGDAPVDMDVDAVFD